MGCQLYIRAFNFFPQGTARDGPSSGLRANHLKESGFCPSPRNTSVALHLLCNFITLLSSDQVVSDVVRHLCGASLYQVILSNGATDRMV